MDAFIPVFIAVISGGSAAVAAIVVAVIQSRAQHSKTLAEMDKRDALQAQRIEQLEKKMDKHNRLIERTYALEKSVELLKKDVENIGRAADKLKKYPNMSNRVATERIQHSMQ